MLLQGFYKGGVHVEGSYSNRVPFLDRGNKVTVDEIKGLKVDIRQRDEGLALFAFLLFLLVMKSFEVANYG